MFAPISLGEILTSLLAVWVLTALHRRDPDPPLRYWAIAFALQALTNILVAHRLLGPEIVWASAVASVAAALGAVFLVWGTVKYLGGAIDRRWLFVPVALIAFALIGVAAGLPFVVRAVPVVLALGGSLVFVGASVAREWRRRVGARVASLGLISYGVHILDYPFVAEMPALLPWGHALAAFLQVVICVGLVLLYFERARDRLAEREADYHALFDNAVVGIFVADASGRIVAANRTLQDLVGSGGTLTGRQLRALFEDPSEAEALLNAERVSLTSHAVQWRSDDGRVLDVQLYSRRVAREYGADLTEGVVVDVTRMANLERHLDQVQRAEVLGQLAGGIAHDINNVLTVILANSDLLDRVTRDTPRATELIAATREASRQGASLTRQLLTFTRRHPSSTERFDLGPRIERAVRMLEPALSEATALELRVTAEECGVAADPALIEQMVVNLVLNARDAMPDGGRIQVSVQRDDSSPRLPIVLEVKDDGVGMDAETRQHAFEPFFSTKTQGTGLGLAVVQRVVKQSSGSLQLVTAPGEGTTFRIRFPAVTLDGPEAPAAPRRDSAGGSGARVLVVEDRADVRQVLVASLASADFHVTAPATAQGALDCIASTQAFDLLVTDVKMPDVSGPEVARAYRDRVPGAPIIFVSGFADAEELPEVLVSERTRFLSKPFTPEALIDTAQELLDDEGPAAT